MSNETEKVRCNSKRISHRGREVEMAEGIKALQQIDNYIKTYSRKIMLEPKKEEKKAAGGRLKSSKRKTS